MLRSWNEVRARAAKFADDWGGAAYEKGETRGPDWRFGGRLGNAPPGVAVEGEVDALVAHEHSRHRARGLSGSLRIEPGASERGLSLALEPAWGTAGSGAERLRSLGDAGCLLSKAEIEPRSASSRGWAMGCLRWADAIRARRRSGSASPGDTT